MYGESGFINKSCFRTRRIHNTKGNQYPLHNRQHFVSAIFLDGSVPDPDPGSGAFLTPVSGKRKKSGSGFGMNIPDHFSESLETVFRVKNP
jgi:hypothetical protein